MDYYEYREAVLKSDLPTHAKIVALVISYHYNWKDKTPAYPSNKTLSQETSLSIASVVRAKNILINNGLLLTQRRWDAPTEYTPALPEQTPCSQGATNNEYNNEVNNEINNDIKVDSFQSSTFANNNNLNQGGLDDIWEIFERTDRRRQGPAGRSRTVNRQDNKRFGTNEDINAAVPDFNKTVAEIQGQEW